MHWQTVTGSQRKLSDCDRDYQGSKKKSYEQIKTEYEKFEQDMAAEDEKINAIRDEMSQSAVTKEQVGEPWLKS